MRSWRYCVNPVVISIAPLTAILVMTAAVSAIAGTKGDRVACDERSFTPDDAGLRIGQANGTSSAELGVVSPEVLPAGAGFSRLFRRLQRGDDGSPLREGAAGEGEPSRVCFSASEDLSAKPRTD